MPIAEKLRILQNRDSSVLDLSRRASRALWFTVRARCGLDTTSILRDINAQIILPPNVRGVTRMIYTYGSAVEPEIATLRNFVSPGMTVCDIGANFGIYTLHLARLVGPSGKVLAFEPVPYTASYLRRTIELNRLSNVLLSTSALADASGEGAIIGKSGDLGSNAIVPSSHDSPDAVPITTLDDYCGSINITRVDFVKMDIEGGEYAALRGARNVLKRDRPVILFEVNPSPARLHNLNGDEAFELLRGAGYHLYSLQGQRWAAVGDAPRDLTNVLAAPFEVSSTTSA